MTTHNTGNPIGSRDPRDLYDNVQNLDVAMNTDELSWTDRLGVVRPSWQGAIGNTLNFDYQEGNWTPLFKIGSTTIATGATSSRWKKVGNLVYANFDFSSSTFTLGSATGSATIAGLPYTSNDSGSTGLSIARISGNSPFAFLGFNEVFHFVPSGSTSISLAKNTGGLSVNITEYDMKASQASVFYRGTIVYGLT